jgi:hypothetical protein
MHGHKDPKKGKMDTCEVLDLMGWVHSTFRLTLNLLKSGLEAIMEHAEFFQPLLLFHPLQFWGIQKHHH